MATFNSYEFELLRAKRHADRVKQKQIVHEIRHRNDSSRQQISFSKLAVIFICLNALAIEIYSMWIMYAFHDISHLSSLLSILGALIAQGVTIAGYFSKSAKENTQGGIVYQNMVNEFQQSMNNMNSQIVPSENNVMAMDEEEDTVG